MFLSAHPLQIFTRSLSEYFHLDEKAARAISEQLSPCLTTLSDIVIDEFLTLVKKVHLTPLHSQTFHQLASTDAVIKAPQFHKLVFENEHLRILQAIVAPGEIVPFHSHQWNSIVLTLQGATFTTDDGNSVSEEECFPSAEYSEGSFKTYSYQNVGSTQFQAIVFELKT